MGTFLIKQKNIKTLAHMMLKSELFSGKQSWTPVCQNHCSYKPDKK